MSANDNQLGGPRTRQWHWHLRDRRSQRVCAVLTGAFIAYMILYFEVKFFRQNAFSTGDFFALWSYPKIAMTHQASILYDFARLHSAQVSLGMAQKVDNPFPYPPNFLLLFWPIGLLPYQFAYAAFMLVSLLAYIVATCTGHQRPRLMALAIALAPTTTVTIIAGQSGFVVGALLVGGLRLMHRRPLIAGVLLGLLTYKPQFGLMVPFALLGARQWRCMAATCVTIVLLVVTSSALFGWEMWPDWTRALPRYDAWCHLRLTGNRFMTSVTANLEILRVPGNAIVAIQALVTLLSAVGVFLAFRLCTRAVAIPVTIVASCLAAPHAFIYDLPMLSSAVMLIVGYRSQSHMSFSTSEVATVVFALLFPAIVTLVHVGLPIAAFVYLMLIAVTIRPGLDGRHKLINVFSTVAEA